MRQDQDTFIDRKTPYQKSTRYPQVTFFRFDALLIKILTELYGTCTANFKIYLNEEMAKNSQSFLNMGGGGTCLSGNISFYQTLVMV